MSLGTGLATIALETAGVIAAVALIGVFLGLRRSQLTRLAVAAVAALTAAVTLSSLPSSAAYLNRERQAAVGTQAGIEHCAYESAGQSMLPFLRWARTKIPPRDRYWLAPSPLMIDAPPGVDPLCVALLMLPRLPTDTPASSDWVMYTGAFTPALSARIAAHDPSVHVYSRGFALVRAGGS